MAVRNTPLYAQGYFKYDALKSGAECEVDLVEIQFDFHLSNIFAGMKATYLVC